VSKLDYCNVALVGLARCDLDRLQAVINTATSATTTSCYYWQSYTLADGRGIQCKLCMLSIAECYVQSSIEFRVL